jgi:hypothetical protein
MKSVRLAFIDGIRVIPRIVTNLIPKDHLLFKSSRKLKEIFFQNRVYWGYWSVTDSQFPFQIDIAAAEGHRVKIPISVYRYSRSPHNFAATQIYCATACTLFVHWLPDKRLAWSQSCEGFVNMAPQDTKITECIVNISAIFPLFRDTSRSSHLGNLLFPLFPNNLNFNLVRVGQVSTVQISSWRPNTASSRYQASDCPDNNASLAYPMMGFFSPSFFSILSSY